MIWVDTLITVNLPLLRLCFFYSWVVWGAGFVEPKRIITQVREAERKARCEEAASPGPSGLHQEAGYHLSGWEPGWEAHTHCSLCIMMNSTSSPPMTGTSRKCQVETPFSPCVPTARGRAAKTAEESRCLAVPLIGAYSLCGLSVPRRLECRQSGQGGPHTALHTGKLAF